MPSVSFEHVQKRFGDSAVVEDFDLVVADGELLVLVGGSGSGKSTILRLMVEPGECGALAVAVGPDRARQRENGDE